MGHHISLIISRFVFLFEYAIRFPSLYIYNVLTLLFIRMQNVEIVCVHVFYYCYLYCYCFAFSLFCRCCFVFKLFLSLWYFWEFLWRGESLLIITEQHKRKKKKNNNKTKKKKREIQKGENRNTLCVQRKIKFLQNVNNSIMHACMHMYVHMCSLFKHFFFFLFVNITRGNMVIFAWLCTHCTVAICTVYVFFFLFASTVASC